MKRPGRSWPVPDSEVILKFSSNMYVRATVEFIHGISAGLYPGAVLATWIIRKQVETAAPPATTSALAIASVSLWLVLMVDGILLIATGAFRLHYWRLNIREGFVEKKRRMIAMKHAAFVMLLIVSVAFTFTLVPG